MILFLAPCTLLQFILKSYFPKIDEVIGLFKKQHEAARENSRTIDPLSPGFAPPLLRAECQMIALFIHLYQMNTKMVYFTSTFFVYKQELCIYLVPILWSIKLQILYFSSPHFLQNLPKHSIRQHSYLT